MNKSKNQGFTLIEMLIVVVVAAILASVAWPNYRDYVIRTKRAVATGELLKVLNTQEQYFVNTKGYATDLTDLGYPANGYYIDSEGDASASSSSDQNYLIRLAASPTPSATVFKLEAVPQNGQAADGACGTLTLTSTGTKGSSAGSVAKCW